MKNLFRREISRCKKKLAKKKDTYTRYKLMKEKLKYKEQEKELEIIL